MKKKLKCLLFAALLLLSVSVPAVRANAVTTDEILQFVITVDVNEDASLQMDYMIEWKVLDDKTYGPLEWINLGVPNSHHENITVLSDTIDYIKDNGDTLAIWLEGEYYANEIVTLEFSMTQDYMYQIDKYVEGETVYSFTPAWFDGMDVDQLEIRWNSENASAWQPDCLKDGDYLVFTASVPSGGKYTMNVTYPNDAFGFSPDRQAGSSSGSGTLPSNPDYGDDNNFANKTILEKIAYIFGTILAYGFSMAFSAAPVVFIVLFSRFIRRRGSGFGSSTATEKKITRTKIEYFANCPSCGAVRQEGKDSCPYCGRSMIKSKEIVEESQIEHPENYVNNGTYRYGNAPNTYIMVNVVNIPVRHSSTHSSGSSGSSHRSSCASSCAHSCACASHCACACACASSGRAGCSVKDFFKDSIHRGRVKVKK